VTLAAEALAADRMKKKQAESHKVSLRQLMKDFAAIISPP
jgi:hypothetical protein